MQTLRTVFRAIAVLISVAALIGFVAFSYATAHFYEAGLDNVSAVCGKLALLSLLINTLSAFALLRSSRVPDQDCSTPYCHVGRPL